MSRAEDIAQWIENELGILVVDRQQSNTAAVEEYDLFLKRYRMAG